jgi:hypothetical protein
MAYTKTTWVDEVLSGAERFVIKDNAGAAPDAWADLAQCQISLYNTVTTAGTPVNAATMQNIEDGIYALSRAAGYSLKGVSGSSTGDVADITASSDNTVLRRSGSSIGFGTVPNAALADHKELVYLKVYWHDETISTGDGKLYFTVPAYLAGAIVDFDISIITASSSGLVTVQMANCGTTPVPTGGTDILSTRATIDVGEYTSMTAATQPVISNPTVSSGQFLRIDIDVAGTGAKGLDVFFVIEKSA